MPANEKMTSNPLTTTASASTPAKTAKTTTTTTTTTETNAKAVALRRARCSAAVRSGHLAYLLSSTVVAALVVGLALLARPGAAFQYDIWFKYPHPYTQSDPVNYCAESVAGAPAAGAGSGRQTNAAAGVCQSALPVYVNTLDSPKTLIPYTIQQLLDFCPLGEAREYEHSQHTEWDDNIRLAPFDIKWQRPEECKLLCRRTYKMNSANDMYRMEELKLGLTRDYYHHWFTDTFPFGWCYRWQPEGAPGSFRGGPRAPRECFIGFPIGYTTDERGLPEDERVPIGNFTKASSMFLFNHFDFTFMYESGEGKPWAGKLAGQVSRITALRVSPRSINHELVAQLLGSAGAAGPAPTAATSAAAAAAGSTPASTNGQQPPAAAAIANRCSLSMPPLEVPSQQHYGLNASLAITYSYSVRFVEDEPTAQWAQRWHRLEALLPGTAKGRWIVALTLLLLLATALPAAYALGRTLLAHRRLGWLNPRDEASQEAAWRLLAGDIFREPLHIGLFSVLVGSGCQFIASVLLSELFSAFLALFSTTILVVVVLLFVLVHGFVGGYAAIRLYRTFGGEQWRTICALVTLLNPLVIFCLLVMSRNLLLLYNGSLMALNVGLFGSLFMAALCFAVSLPSALAGGNVAFKMAAIDFPVRPTANQRQLPDQLVWRRPLVTTLLVGLVPLVCFWCVEAYPFYDSGGYFITVITILIVICLSVSHCYLHLSQFDYRWWWRSYLACGIAAGYYFLHCAYYISTNLFVDTLTNALLYLSFALLICVALFLLTGTIGFLVTFAYLWQTYARTNASPDMNYAMFQKGGQME